MKNKGHLARGGAATMLAIWALVGYRAAHAQSNGVLIDTRQAATPGMQQAVQGLAQRAQARGQVRVIIGLDMALEDEDGLSAAQQSNQALTLGSAQNGVARRSGIAASGTVKFQTIPFMSAFVTAGQLQALINDPNVVSIKEDIPDRPLLAESVPLIRANKVWKRGFTGEGQVVAILDTGSEDTHPMLRNKLVKGFCRSTTNAGNQSTSVCPGGVSESNALHSGRPCPDTVNGCYHGTHVASIAVGQTGALKGVARGADFIAGQVFSRFAAGSGFCSGGVPCALSFNTDQIAGLERVFQLRNQFSIASVNMSLGGGQFDAFCDASDPGRSAIINKLTRNKIAVVIAAGNNGFDGFISGPACIKNAVAVGSTTKADAISSFSNHSVLVDVMAPGSSINAALPGGTFGVLSGTSMATPHIAGVFALLRQAYPNATVNDLLKVMRKSGPQVSRDGVTKRRIDVLTALNKLDANPPSQATGALSAD